MPGDTCHSEGGDTAEASAMSSDKENSGMGFCSEHDAVTPLLQGTADWEMWPINHILYKKLWSSEKDVEVPCECIRHRCRWGREGHEDRGIGFVPGESVFLHLQEGRKKR